MKRFFLVILTFVLSVVSVQARERVMLNDDWRFYFTSENSADYARSISLPHTWAYDAGQALVSPQPTTANYLRALYVPSEWGEKRLFLKFYGVESVATLFVNGQYVGEHRGGSTAFIFEVTSKIKAGAENRVHVIVNNAPQNDVLPTSREEDSYGGIYRDVELIATDKSAISPLYYGSEGVLVHTEEVSAERAKGSVKVHLTSKGSSTCALSLSILDDAGNEVYKRHVGKAKINAEGVNIPFEVESPKLWSTSSPNLYTVVVELTDGEMSDKVSVRTGFRGVSVGDNDCININGERVGVRAVTLYHDYPSVGGAASQRDVERDVELITQMGANTIRSATHPHSQYLYNICDEQGVLSWIDFPLVKAPFLSDVAYYPTAGFEAQGIETVREIIAQNINHPSVVMWGVFSMMTTRGDDTLPYITKLNKLAKELDPSRLTVAVSDQDGDINKQTDLIVWKQRFGWNKGLYSDVDVWRNILHRDWKSLKSGVAYGERGRIDQQTSRSDFQSSHSMDDATWSPESRQRIFHEEYSRMLLPDTLFWGVCLTNMFDFKSVRNSMGENNSGMVTFDRRDKKDAYYLYKANWNRAEPTLHIAGRRASVVREPRHRLSVYSSESEAPTLIVNSDTVKLNSLPAAQFATDSVMLRKGVNRIKVVQGNMADSVEVTLQTVGRSSSFSSRPLR